MIFLKTNIIGIFNDEIAMHNCYPNDRKYDIKEVFELYWDDFLQANKYKLKGKKALNIYR